MADGCCLEKSKTTVWLCQTLLRKMQCFAMIGPYWKCNVMSWVGHTDCGLNVACPARCFRRASWIFMSITAHFCIDLSVVLLASILVSLATYLMHSFLLQMYVAFIILPVEPRTCYGVCYESFDTWLSSVKCIESVVMMLHVVILEKWAK